MSILSFIKNLFQKRKGLASLQPKLSQSSIYDSMKHFLVVTIEEKPLKTQATEFERKQYVPVMLVDHQAYWILNNTLMVADEIDGSIDKDSARAVDTMGMDKVQLDKTIFIVDALTEGAENDSWNSRN
jgi:hypothetical protein